MGSEGGEEAGGGEGDAEGGGAGVDLGAEVILGGEGGGGMTEWSGSL